MFTGIVAEVGEVVEVDLHGTDRDLLIHAAMAPDLRLGESVSHNGACLTVVEVLKDRYRVTAVEETLQRSALGDLTAGDAVNLERSLRLGDRLDGHFVQGHVDLVARCGRIEDRAGSWVFAFELPAPTPLLVEKGSICVNGASLTVAALDGPRFSVAIVPYTYQHTTFRSMKPGDRANVEFDVLGKYVERLMRP